jgi:S1-C subfamily serine protease
VRDLTPQLASYFQVQGGVLVLSVAKDSVAARSGMKAGDIIEGTSQQSPLSASQLEQALLNENSVVSLKVVRERKPIVIKLNGQQQ